MPATHRLPTHRLISDSRLSWARTSFFATRRKSNDDELPPGSTLREMLEDERQETEEVKPLIDHEES